tara:strand:+ start:3189 stop:3827 length:639 start_codon:yes stop_codon:yes gene_type:complete
MDHRSLSRELSLISLGLVKDSTQFELDKIQFDNIFESAIELMVNHCREELDECEVALEQASNNLLESELREISNSFFEKSRDEIKSIISQIEKIMNTLSDTLDFPNLIAISDQTEVRSDIEKRIIKVIKNFSYIDKNIDDAMEGWRFKRLPRIDRDILRLAFVDINFLQTPVSVACNEAVNLANKYSDPQGRKMINGVLRRLQNKKLNDLKN